MNQFFSNHTGNKLTTIQGLAENASTEASHHSDSDLLSQNHHLYTIYPMIFEKESEMFGNWSAKKDNYHDGLFTFLWRRVNRVS